MTEPDKEPQSAAASLFDLRTVIALLFVVYGIVLIVLGIVADGPAELAKSGGIDLNLWTGVAMVLLAVGFAAWARLRPLHPAAPAAPDEPPPP